MVMTNNNSIGIFKRIVLTLLFSVVSVFLVFPLINGFQFLKNLYNSASWKTVIGLSALNVLILIALSEKAISFWKRYYNTTKGKFSHLVFVDLLVSYFIISGFLIYFFFFIGNKLPTVLLLNLIIFIIWVCVTRFLGKGLLKKIGEEAAQTVSEKTLSDEPIRVSVQDRLGRGKFVYDLYRQISKLTLPLTGSFTIGLYGSWGEGKTSVLNLLEEKFENCDDFLIIRFDPWYFEDEDAIFAAFYNQIETAITDQFVFQGFKKIIERYKKIISTGLSFSGISFGLKDKDDSIEKTKKKIEDFIRRIDRKLLIIIDDIDRLQPDEASLIFKLVRKNTNFSNTIFLLSFDPVVVGNYLNEIITGDSEFIDKVINMPVSIPAIEQENIDNFLFDEINELFNFLEIPGKKKDAFEKNFHQDVYHSFIKKLIKTLRQAKRYLNGIYATLRSIVNEVNLFDFFLLESIRIFNPELYRDIWENYNDYIYNPKRLMIEDPDRLLMEDKEYEKPVKERITKLLGTESQTQKIFRELICILFPNTIGKIFKELKQLKDVYRSGEEERLEKRLSHTECFPKYFIHKIPLHEESDGELERLIFTLKSEKPKDQKIILGKKLSEIGEKRCPYDFLKLLLDFSGEIDSNLARSIAEVIYEKADLISDDNVRNLSLLELKLIDDNLDSNSIKEVIEKLVLNTPNFYFVTDIVSLTSSINLANISKSIDNDLLKIQLSDRLKKHFIDGQRDIFETVHDSGLHVVLYSWGSDWGTNSGKSSQIVSDYVFSRIEVDIKKFSKFLKFVGYLVGQEKTSDFILNFEKFKKIFNWQAFVKIVCNFKDNPELTNEEISLIQGVLKQASKEAEEAEKTRVVRKKAKT